MRDVPESNFACTDAVAIYLTKQSTLFLCFYILFYHAFAIEKNEYLRS